MFLMFENPRTGRQARNFTTSVPKILDLKSSFEQIFSENYRFVTARIIASLDFISAVQYMIHFINHFVHTYC